MASNTQLRLLQMTGSFGIGAGQINDSTAQKAQTGSIASADLGESLSYMAAAIRRIHGGDWFSNQTAGVFSQTLTPSTIGGFDLGSTGAEWGDIFVADGKKLALGSGQESFIIDKGPGLQIGSSEVIDIGIDANTSDINIGTINQAKTITIGDDASTKVDLNALAIELDSAGSIVLNSTTTTTLDSTTGMSLDAGAASNFTTSAGALTLDGAAGVSIVGNAAEVDVTTSAALDLNSGAGSWDASTLSLDATDDSNFTVTTAAKDLTLAVAGGGAQKLQLDSAGTGTDAIDISASAGGIDVDAAAAVDILAGTTMTIKGAGASIYGDDTATLDFDGAGAVSETGMTSFVITPGGVTTLGGTGLVTLDSSGAANDINIGVEAAAKDIVIGNAASAKVDVNALVIELDAASKVVVDAASTDADAVAVTSSGGIDIGAAGGAVDVTTSAGNNAINVLPHGTGTLTLGADANTKVDVNALAIELDAGATGVLIDSLGGVAVNADDNSRLDLSTAAKGWEIRATGGGTNRVSLISSGTAANSVEILGGGGVQIHADPGKSINAGTGGQAELFVTPHTTAADSKISMVAENGTAVNITTPNSNALSLQAPAGGCHLSGDALIFSGSGVNAITFAADGSMTSGVGNKGILFADHAEYATFRANSGMNAGTTVIGAINTLASQVSGATATVFTGSIVADVAAGGNVTVAKQAGDNANLVTTCGIQKVQTYVNGQLLVSSSIGKTNDYQITANNTIQFQFGLKIGDMVMVIDRS